MKAPEHIPSPLLSYVGEEGMFREPQLLETPRDLAPSPGQSWGQCWLIRQRHKSPGLVLMRGAGHRWSMRQECAHSLGSKKDPGVPAKAS